MQKIFLVFPVAVLLFGSSCSTTPTVQYNQSTDFSRYRTFALMPRPTTEPASNSGAASRLAEPARQAIVATLQAKGYTEAEREKADFVVQAHGQAIPRIEVRDWGYSSYDPADHRRPSLSPSPRDLEVRSSEERTLTIEIFDNQSKQAVWAGWKTQTSSEPVTAFTLQDAIREILAPFPPEPTAAPSDTAKP